MTTGRTATAGLPVRYGFKPGGDKRHVVGYHACATPCNHARNQ